MAKPTGTKTMPMQVRMDEGLRAEIKTASEKLDMSDQDVIRLSIKIGLAKLKRIKFDLASAALDAADHNPVREKWRFDDVALVAEEPEKKAREQPHQQQQTRLSA